MEAVINLRRDGAVLRQIIHVVDQRLRRLADIRRLRGDVILLGILVEREVGRVVRRKIVVPDTLLVARRAAARPRRSR